VHSETFITSRASPLARWRQSGRTSLGHGPAYPGCGPRVASIELLPSARIGMVGCSFVAAERYRARTASAAPELGPFLFGGRYRVRAELGHSPFQSSWASKAQFNGVGRLRTYISYTRIRHSSESFTMDCDHSKLKATVFGIHDWLNYLQDQAAKYRKLVEQADDPFVKTELLALASVCDEIADNIEDHLTGGEDHAPRGPLSRLS
jgi:hypothetical protein